MQKWLKQQIKWLRDHEPWQDDLQLAADAAHIIDEARRRAIDAGRPDLAKLCQADWAIGLTRAQEILSAFLETPGDRKRPPPELLTLQQAADRLGYTAKGLRKLVKRGEIRFLQARPRSPIKFRPEWLDEFIDRRKPPTENRQPSRSAHGFDAKLLG
jgi:excisionase family DNA binding protein